MENSNKFWTIIFRILPFADFLHILQLEDYNTTRYFRRVNYLFFRRDLQRLECLTWTTRAKITLVLAVFLAGIGILAVAQYYLLCLLLLFYFAYNRTGPKILWLTLLWAAFLLNTFIQISVYFDVTHTFIPQAVEWLSLGVFGLLILLAIIIGLLGRTSLPTQGRIIWQALIGLFLVAVLLPVEDPVLAVIKLILLFLSLSLLFIPVWVGLANLLLSPIYFFGKTIVQKKATNLLAGRKDLKVIVVAGSYGKTTTKNFIEQFLRFNYRLQMVPGNINTATGIAQWLLANLKDSTEVLLVEADGYDAREYIHTGQMLRSEVVVITNIGDQHLERFKTRRNLASSMLRLAELAKPKAKVVISAMTQEDVECWELYNKRLLSDKTVQVVPLDEKIKYQNKIVSVKNLSTSNQVNLRFALQVAQNYEIPVDFVLDTIKELELPERRQSEIEMYGFEVLDDSYNISYTTAQAGLGRAAKRAKELKKKLLVIFAGIPELGKENATANTEYAKLLSENADAVVLLETILISEVQASLAELDFEQVYLASRMTEAWEVVKANFDSSDYYVLMQPELNDLYYAS